MFAFISWTLTCIIIWTLYMKLKTCYQHWERKGIKGPKPHFIVGNVFSVLGNQKSITDLIYKYYKQYPEEKFIGIYEGTRPGLIVRDPELVKLILKTDHINFMDRGLKVTDEPLLQNLFLEEGDMWKMMHQKISPVFSTFKLKQMMPLLNSSVKEYMEYIDKLVEKQSCEQEITNMNKKYCLKNVMLCAFHLDCASFSDERNLYKEIGDKIFKPNMKGTIIHFLNAVAPGLPVFLKLKFVSHEITTFFLDLVSKVIKEREGKPILGKDLMDHLIELRKQGKITQVNNDGAVEIEVTDAIVASQVAAFFVTVYDSIAALMSSLLYSLALNSDVQEKCHAEVKNVMENSNCELTYESMKELRYLSMTTDECLRKYPGNGLKVCVWGTGVICRQNSVDYRLSGLDIEKGTKIYIPVKGLQNDPKYFPEPEKFIPERFSPQNIGSITDGTYLPFGGGPRMCMGMRWAKLQSLMGIAHFLFNYKVEPTERTPTHTDFDPFADALRRNPGIWLNVKRR